MTIPIISSTSNAQVKQLIQLQKKAKLRAEQDVFIVEGIKMYQEVPQKRLVHTYASESFYNKKRELFDGKEKNLTVFTDLIQNHHRGFCVWCGSIIIPGGTSWEDRGKTH